MPALAPAIAAAAAAAFALIAFRTGGTAPQDTLDRSHVQEALFANGPKGTGWQHPFRAGSQVEGHADFHDGRGRDIEKVFATPSCEGCYWTNVMLGNGGPEVDLSGGMIPAVGPPFAMTRWTPQTRQNYVSMCPYNQTDTTLSAFLGTHQPAVWMGESGPAQIFAGLGEVVTDFDARALPFDRKDEYASPNYYRTILDAGQNGKVEAELASTERVGHLRFTFQAAAETAPHVIVQASRPSILISDDNVFRKDLSNVTYPDGWVKIDQDRNEVYGRSTERQDYILVGDELPAKGFKGYFVARFSQAFDAHGTSNHGRLAEGQTEGHGADLAGWVTFPRGTPQVTVRVGTSFISVEQARRNLDLEIPDGQELERTSEQTRQAWKDKLDTLSVTGATPANRTVLYTAFAHTLVYPYITSEPTDPKAISTSDQTDPSLYSYYSGYTDRVERGISYSGYSIWDTFRAETAWLLFTAPEHAGKMITSMLQDYKQGGWLPMWKNIVETNIMVGTHSDSMIAQAMQAGVKDFDWDLAWEAVRKNAFTPPDRDTELKFADREEHTPQEARAGLTEYMKLGYVADDLHSEAGSRTLDYAYDDHAAAIVAEHIGAHEDAKALRERAKNYRTMWNEKTGFMETRNSDGSWAGETAGWTEGDHWAYSLTVMHDVPGLIELMGGNDSFVGFMDRHFEGGHNLHTNEPSHHIPYMYAYAGAPHKAQEWVRHIGENDYGPSDTGLSGNEDCGQMSAWYLFSAMGFYPVDPASAIYTIGAPFFDSLTLRIPNASKPLTITAEGASAGKKYVRSVTIDGEAWNSIFIPHSRLANGADIIFEMSDVPEVWST